MDIEPLRPAAATPNHGGLVGYFLGLNRHRLRHLQPADRADLVQELELALIELMPKHDPARGSLSAFAILRFGRVMQEFHARLRNRTERERRATDLTLDDPEDRSPLDAAQTRDHFPAVAARDHFRTKLGAFLARLSERDRTVLRLLADLDSGDAIRTHAAAVKAAAWVGSDSLVYQSIRRMKATAREVFDGCPPAGDLGRKRQTRLSQIEAERIARRYEAGESIASQARQLGVSKTTVRNALRERAERTNAIPARSA